MKRLAVFVSLFFIVSSIWVPVAAAGGKTLEELVRDQIRKSGAKSGLIGVAVTSHKGTPLVLLNADKPFKPASNMKILTTVAGLELLGAGHEYSTWLLAAGGIVGGKISGDLVVRGAGDPNISGRFHKDDPLAIFTAWAGKLKKLGLREISGNLVADDSFFDNERFLDGWNPKDRGKWFSAQISPLSLNDNCVEIRVVPGAIGKPARVSVFPANSFVSVSGAPKTVSGKKVVVVVNNSVEGNKVTVKGTIGASAGTWRGHLPIDDPALFFAHTFAAVLKKQGIELGGDVVRIGGKEVPGGGSAPEKSGPVSEKVLLEHRSRLDRDIPIINKESMNLHAELLLKTVGNKIVGEGSVAGGAKAIGKLLDEMGAKKTGLVVSDGSGLSHNNRVTARQFVSVLHAARSKKYYELFRSSLPVAGVDGTLKKRFSSKRSLVGKVFAKTGYIRGVSTLSGYVKKNKQVWSFSILCNSFPSRSLSQARKLQEDIIGILYASMQ